MAFHIRIAEAASNLSLLQIMTSIRSLLQVWITRVRAAEVDNRRSTNEHEQVRLAIEAGDPDAARSAMEAHMDSATRRLALTLEAAGSEAASPPTNDAAVQPAL
jgi:DNA-binding FadR family transcriptional regulator